jgi:uncharacterized protein YyaL (SSP411 family)
LVVKQGAHLANWASLYAALLRPGAEIAIIGPEAEDFREELSRHFLFDAVLAGAESASELSLLKLLKAPDGGRTAIHICRNQACLAPVYSVAEARKLLADF